MIVAKMAEALKARDEGMASSANHAETDAPGWGDRAYQAVKALDYVDTFTMEYLRMVLEAHGKVEPPAELRAWGSVTQRLIRDEIIERVGYFPAASSNGSPKALYRIVRAG